MAKKLVSMARTKAEKKAAEERYKTMPSSGEDYPYGLCLNLGKEELTKLGVGELPNVGDEITLDVVAKVTRVSASASETDDQKSVELQVIKMAVEAADDDTPAQRLYGKKG